MDVSLTRSNGVNVGSLLRIEGPEEIATLEQRLINSWTSSILARSARLRIHHAYIW